MKQAEQVRRALNGELISNGRSQMLACATEIRKLRLALQNVILNRPISHHKPWMLSLQDAIKLLQGTNEEIEIKVK